MFKKIKLLLLLILLMVACATGMILALQNDAPASLILFGYSLPQLSVGLWVVIALLFGAIIGFLLSFLPRFFMNYSRAAKDKKIQSLEKEISRLRVSGVKG